MDDKHLISSFTALLLKPVEVWEKIKDYKNRNVRLFPPAWSVQVVVSGLRGRARDLLQRALGCRGV